MIEGKPIKVAVCIPVLDMAPSFFAYDLARMMAYNTVKGINTGLMMATGSLIPKQRNTLTKSALDHDPFTHIMWLDSDMRFPKDTVERLLAHKLPLVCASYTERTPPFRPVAFPNISDVRERLYTLPDTTGLSEIHACGFGCMLVETDMVRKMSKPWFMLAYVPESESVVGEDLFFLTKARQETGAKLYMDHDLTKELAHIGRFEFDYTHAIKAQVVNEQEELRKEAEQASGAIQLVP